MTNVSRWVAALLLMGSGTLAHGCSCGGANSPQLDADDWGLHASMVLDKSGDPHVAFYHRSHRTSREHEEPVGALIYGVGQRQGDTATFSYTRIDGDVRLGNSNLGLHTSIALAQDGRPWISYYDKDHGDLLVAHEGESGWERETVDADGNVGLYTSIAIAADGRVRVAYYAQDRGDLKFAWREGGAWQRAVVDDGGEADVGLWASLALDAAGNAAITYYDATHGDLKFALASGTTFNKIETIDADTDVGRWPSLALFGGNPRISYEDFGNHRLKFAQRDGGSAWSISVVDASEWVGADSSLAIDEQGRPHVAYFDGFNNDVKYAFLDGGGWSTFTVADGGANGYYNNLAIGPNGSKNFGFYTFTGTDFRFLVRP